MTIPLLPKVKDPTHENLALVTSHDLRFHEASHDAVSLRRRWRQVEEAEVIDRV